MTDHVLWVFGIMAAATWGYWQWLLNRLKLSAFLWWHLPRLAILALVGSSERLWHAAVDAQDEIDRIVDAYVKEAERAEGKRGAL